MAQATVGKDTAIPATDNEPVSMFKHEGKTKMNKNQQTETQAQPPEPQTPTQPTDLAALVAQKKQLEDAIKAARAALPKQSPLERELARQQDAGGPNGRNNFVGPFFAKMVARRIALGQSQDEAMQAVQALWQEWTLATLASLPAKGE